MRLERFFGSYLPSEAVPLRVAESTRAMREFGQFVPREVVLSSRIDEKEDPKTLDQAPEIVQTAEPIGAKPNSDWESFNTQPDPSRCFINLYGGPFSQNMELNRTNAERLLEVTGIEGKIILADGPMDRSRYIDGINSDGSVTARRRLFWGEKIQDEDKPHSLVKSVPEGWRIEIPGQDIMDELLRKESKVPLGKRFASRFNQSLRTAMGGVIVREKLTAEKDPYFVRRLVESLIFPALSVYLSSSDGFTLYALDNGIRFILLMYGAMNCGSRVFGAERMIQRSLRSFYEYLMPMIEIDRVLRGLAFANLKGRNLVRLRPDETKTLAG